MNMRFGIFGKVYKITNNAYKKLRKSMQTLFMLVAALAAISCGQTGDLRLPDEATKSEKTDEQNDNSNTENQ